MKSGNTIKNAIKHVLWKVIGPIICRYIAWYAHDTRYAQGSFFAETWQANDLVLASLRQDYEISTLDQIARLIANHAWRTDLFDFWQQHGFTIYPQYYMSPFPHRDEIPATHWKTGYSVDGLDMNMQGQIEMLEQIFPKYRDGFAMLSGAIPELPGWNPNNSYFSVPDAKALYCFLRHFRPQKVIEVGSGYSTFIMSLGSQHNQSEGFPTVITTVDPEPRADIWLLGENVHIVQQPIQAMDKNEFLSLQANDILFIDSSHVVKLGGDVLREILEILPILQPGVIVHFHDIFLPDEYPRSWVVEEKRFWTEQYLLHAFLIFNSDYEILWASHFMHQMATIKVEACLGSSGGASFWIRRRISSKPQYNE